MYLSYYLKDLIKGIQTKKDTISVGLLGLQVEISIQQTCTPNFFFKSVPLKHVFLKIIHILFYFFSFLLSQPPFHARGCLPWAFLLSCAMTAKYSISPVLKPQLPTGRPLLVLKNNFQDEKK